MKPKLVLFWVFGSLAVLFNGCVSMWAADEYVARRTFPVCNCFGSNYLLKARLMLVSDGWHVSADSPNSLVLTRSGERPDKIMLQLNPFQHINVTVHIHASTRRAASEIDRLSAMLHFNCRE